MILNRSLIDRQYSPKITTSLWSEKRSTPWPKCLSTVAKNILTKDVWELEKF